MREMNTGSQIGPYGGYLLQVSKDYFLGSGLRPSHNAVFNGMDPATQQAVQPYMPDFKPMGELTPPLLRELPRATLGAWGNYLGDMYLGGIAPPEVRRSVAVGSTLIMAMLEADEVTWRTSPKARDARSVTLSYAHMRGAITGQNTHVLDSGELAYEPHRAMQLLAHEVHTRVADKNDERQAALVDKVHSLADVRHDQFQHGHREIGDMLVTALDMGELTAEMALDLTAQRPEVRAWPPDVVGEKVAIALGKIGAMLTHGTHVDTAFRDRMPTYATAIIMNEYGPTKTALTSIRQHREEYVSMLINRGKEALKDGTRRQRGIFRMAVRLLKIRQGGDVGSTEAIKESMRADPYWNAYL